MSIPASRDTQLKREKLYPDVIRLPLDDARVCLNCDTIHNGEFCPICASANFMELSSVLGRIPQNYRFQYDLGPVQIPEQVPERVVYTSNGSPLKSVVLPGR